MTRFIDSVSENDKTVCQGWRWQASALSSVEEEFTLMLSEALNN